MLLEDKVELDASLRRAASMSLSAGSESKCDSVRFLKLADHYDRDDEAGGDAPPRMSVTVV